MDAKSKCVLVAIVFLSQTIARGEELRVHQAKSTGGMVVCESSHASHIGRDVLSKGGNAVDAAVATAFTLAVTWPEAGNIGGGGFMMIHPSNGSDPVCVDYREVAPGSATKTMFSRTDGRHTHKIVGVPGTVRGLALAHKKYGKLPWRDLVMPAAKLAENGFEMDKFLAGSINSVCSSIRGDRKQVKDQYKELVRIYGGPRLPRQTGDRLVQKDLAKTLRAIAIGGADAFYKGEIAEQIVAEMKRGDGRITKEDLAKYRAKVRKPIHGAFRDHDVYGAPPPSSGGICVVQMLNVLENFDLASQDRFSVRNTHLVAEAMRRAFADRARHLGDQDFVEIPTHLTTKDYARKLAKGIDLNRATDSETLTPDIKITDESKSTTHFSVVDASGMAVANTYTLENSWGSRIVVHGAGFLLNNEMGDFNWLPGKTTHIGRIGTKANQIEPYKRMLSSQSPTIVARDGKVVLVTGSPGGRTIINTVVNIVLNVVEFKMPIANAIESPRFHHQWIPDRLYLEGGTTDRFKDLTKQLRDRGHNVGSRKSQGSAHSIWIDPKTEVRHGVADYRRGGLAAGTE